MTDARSQEYGRQAVGWENARSPFAAEDPESGPAQDRSAKLAVDLQCQAMLDQEGLPQRLLVPIRSRQV